MKGLALRGGGGLDWNRRLEWLWGGGGGKGREDGRYANRGSMEFWYKRGKHGLFQNKKFVFQVLT